MKKYLVWYLDGDLGIYGQVALNRTVEARDIRSASRKVRRWSDRRDYLIAKAGSYVLEPGGGPLVLLGKQVKTKEGIRYFKNIRVEGTTPAGFKF